MKILLYRSEGLLSSVFCGSKSCEEHLLFVLLLGLLASLFHLDASHFEL